MTAVSEERGTRYRVLQKGLSTNIPVSDFESLVTHHPSRNRNALVQDGKVVGGEPRRLHAIIGGEIQEIEVRAGKQDYQVMLKKDFILEHPHRPEQSGARDVDVPSPAAGFVSRVIHSQGLVDVADSASGRQIARVRHLSGIEVELGDQVDYGATLGRQGKVAADATHIHLEMDTGYHAAFEQYIADLVSGRLPIEAEHRVGVAPGRWPMAP